MMTKSKAAVDWLLFDYLPDCLELAGRTRAADVLRSLEADRALKERGKYMSEKLLPHLGLREPCDLVGFIAKSAGDPLYATADRAIRSEPDAELRWELVIGAGKAWYAANDAIETAATAARAAGEMRQAVFGAQIDALYVRLAQQLDRRLAEG